LPRVQVPGSAGEGTKDSKDMRLADIGFPFVNLVSLVVKKL